MPTPNTAPIGAAHGVIESIIELTEQREQHSLEQSLLGSLAEMLDGLQGWILDLETENKPIQHFDAGGHPTGLPEAVQAAAAALRHDEGAQILHMPELQYLLAPLTGNGEQTLRVLILARSSWNEQEQRLVLGMVRVFDILPSPLGDGIPGGC